MRTATRMRHAALLTLVCVAGCSSPELVSPGTAPTITLLAFGDSGYDYAYLEPDDLAPALTAAEFDAAWREEWLEDKRPLADYALPATIVLPATGGVVEASGLDRVSTAMQRLCAARGCDLAAMLGDNIYPNGATLGADGHDDAERFRRLLYEPFHDLVPGSADFRIYSTLGNHDWNTSRAGALAELRYLETTRPFFMDGLVYRVKPPAARGELEIFAIDTTLLLAANDVPEALLDDDGSETTDGTLDDFEPWMLPQTDLERDIAGWLDRALASSDARWKIVIGHHPLWSSAGSKFQQARVLRRLLLPAVCRDADIYLAGHDHTLEVHTDDCSNAGGPSRPTPLLHVVSGAAAKQRPLNSAFMAYQARENPQLQTLWARGLVWGFAHVTLEPERATVRMLTVANDGDAEPAVAYEYTHPRRSGGTAR
jgi:tartrate-resistant acid phosphatase type 5